MRLRIHHPLFAGFLGVIGLLVVLVVVLVGSSLRRELQEGVRSEMERLLALGEAIVSSSTGADPHALARTIANRIGRRVTIVAGDGRVLGDSHVHPDDVPAIEPHGDRPEVAAVLAGERAVAFSERPSSTLGAPLLYGARAATLGGERVVLRIAAEQSAIEATVARVRRTAAGAGVAAMALALVAAYALSIAFARPLVELAEGARRLGRGDLAAPVRHSRVAELHDLSVAFERLTDQLRQRLDELSQERDGMQALIDCMAEGVVALTEDGRLLRTNRTARAMLGLPEEAALAPVGSLVRHPELRRALKDSVEEPEQSREIVIGGRHILLASRALDLGGSVTTLLDVTEVRKAERMRSDFVANASHELKTPLTSIRGYAEALADDPPEPMRSRFRDAILANTLRLQELVDDLLDLSRLESGGWTAELEPVPVREAAEEAWELVAASAGSRVDFAVEGDAAVLADRQGLVHVLRNLLENAVRHTPPGGHVRVRIGPGEREGEVETRVVDDGEGIPAQALPRIFERFYRGDPSRARPAGGTGLGLAIVKHLVGAMHGEVWAESELGRGTTIGVRLPAA